MLGWAVPGLPGYLGHAHLALQQVEVKGQYITVSLELLLGLGEDKRQNLGRENNVTSLWPKDRLTLRNTIKDRGILFLIKSSEQLCLSS